MGPEEGRSYDREMAEMAKGASPGIVRGAPMQHPLDGRFRSPLEEMAKRAQDDYDRRNQDANGPPKGSWTPPVPPQNMPKSSTAAQIEDLADQVASSAHAVDQWRQNASAARKNLAEAEKIFADLATRLSAAMQQHREGPPEGVPYQS